MNIYTGREINYIAGHEYHVDDMGRVIEFNTRERLQMNLSDWDETLARETAKLDSLTQEAQQKAEAASDASRCVDEWENCMDPDMMGMSKRAYKAATFRATRRMNKAYQTSTNSMNQVGRQYVICVNIRKYIQELEGQIGN